MKALPSLRKDCLWVVALLLGGVVVASLGAQDPVEIIRQKPFQRATLAENWGEVEFPVTCVREETQQFFDQGLAQLHTHSYFEAERSFRRVIFTEPDCVMGYWGMAMANIHNSDRASMFLDRAILHRGRSDAREQMFLDALLRYYETTLAGAKARNKILADQKGWPTVPERKFAKLAAVRVARLAADYAAIAEKYPRNLDAMALLANRRILDLPEAASAKLVEEIDAVLERLLQLNRRHPAHFYRLNLWEKRDPARAAKSLTFAMVAASASRNVWQVGGRLYARMGQHLAAATYFEAAARVDHARIVPYRAMPFEVHGYGGTLGSLCESLSALGRGHEALAYAKYMVSLPRHPQSNLITNPDSIAYRGAVQLAKVCHAWGLDLEAQLEGSDPSIQDIARGVEDRYASFALNTSEDMQAPALARRISALQRAGKHCAAGAMFTKLRSIAGTADLDLPVLASLAPIAKALGLPVDWRIPPKELPALWPVQGLVQLGPKFWRPWTPRGFALTSRKGPVVRHTDLRGRAHVVVFFIGNGCCLTCVAQLHLFNAAADDYKAANIDIAAISFHSATDVRASMDKMGAQGFPFRLLADPKMRTWYEWLTVDAHDHAPLHGTFLVDEQGRVRWKQIADHPFENPEWLLAEAKRLLGRKVAGSVR